MGAMIVDSNIFIIVGYCAHRVVYLCKTTANTPFRGWANTVVATQKLCNTFKLALRLSCLEFIDDAYFGVQKFSLQLATVPTGLQSCAKLLQIHVSGGGGTPWLQPKSN